MSQHCYDQVNASSLIRVHRILFRLWCEPARVIVEAQRVHERCEPESFRKIANQHVDFQGQLQPLFQHNCLAAQLQRTLSRHSVCMSAVRPEASSRLPVSTCSSKASCRRCFSAATWCTAAARAVASLVSCASLSLRAGACQAVLVQVGQSAGLSFCILLAHRL